MFLALAQGFMLGLSTGPYCFASCGPLLVPYFLSFGEPGWRRNLLLIAQFLAGRLCAYMLAAVTAFALGGYLSRGERFSGAVTAAAGAYLLAAFFVSKNNKAGQCIAKRFAAATPYAIGLLTGLSPCPPLIAAALRFSVCNGFFQSAAGFLAFFAASSLFILPVIGATPLLLSEKARNIGNYALVLASGWFIVSGLAAFWAN